MEKEKKEIWIEKLIELLNEYEIEKEKSEWVNVDAYVEFKWDYNYNRLVRYDETDHWEWDNLYWDTAVAYLISKSFWFIKWLVENDKINLEEVEKINQTWNVYIRFWWDYEKVLMLLSISDTSIEDLLLYLK